MIRPVTMVTFLAFIGSGLYLYQVKHQAQLVDRQIRKVEEATGAARTRAGVLRAEYALLNDPDRLTELATAYVPDLKPTQPGQWSSMAEIDRRLPPVGGPTVEPSPLEPDAPTHAEPVPVARAEPPRPQLRPAEVAALLAPQPVAVAREPAALPRPAAAPVVAAKPLPHPVSLAVRTQPAAPARFPVNLAHAQPAPLPGQPVPAPVQLAAAPPRATQSLLPRVSAPVGASVLAIAAHPTAHDDSYAAPPATPAEAVARIARGGAVDPTVPMVASALGMARTMMSVTPVSPANAGTLYPQGTTR